MFPFRVTYIQVTYTYSVCWRFPLILFCYLHICLARVFFSNCRKYIRISHYSHICYISWTSNILFKLAKWETNKREHVSACLFKLTNESSKYVQTILHVVQNVPHVSTYSRSRHHTQALMIKIFMRVFNESFIKKAETCSMFLTIKDIENILVNSREGLKKITKNTRTYILAKIWNQNHPRTKQEFCPLRV
jgi:hypothetical protein